MLVALFITRFEVKVKELHNELQLAVHTHIYIVKYIISISVLNLGCQYCKGGASHSRRNGKRYYVLYLK